MATLADSVTATTLSPAVAHARKFTQIYRDHMHSHPAVREAACLRAQFPAVLSPIAAGEMFAGGHIRERITYVGTMWWTTMPHRQGPAKQGGYCFDFGALKRYAESTADREVLAEIDEFWSAQCTWSRIHASWDEQTHQMLEHSPVGGAGSGFVVAPELDILLREGLPGASARVARRLREALDKGDTNAAPFLKGLGDALDVVVSVCRHYERQARSLASDATSEQERERLDRIATALGALAEREPRTLFEATQLWWLYSVMTCGLHIEGWRIDVALGDFYAADIDDGRLTTEQAQEIVCGLWRMFARHSDPAVSRAIVGGRGRRNEPNANRFSLAALEATRRLRQVIPQLTLRFYDGQDPALMRTAFDVLSAGGTYPMLYNDDVNIPGTMKSLHLDQTEAARYYPLGCGEYLAGGASPSLLNAGWSVPQSLEAALGGGRNLAGEQIGPEGPSSFATFDELWSALMRQFEYGAEASARICALNLALAPGDCSYLLGSLYTLDCVERGRSILDGGARYTGSCVMGHGFSNAADSLTAIKALVFDKAEFSLDRLLEALRSNFDGFADLRKRLRAAAKFGNDDPAADQMLVNMWREMSRMTDEAGARHGLHFLTVSSVNPGGYFMGRACAATPDGRLAGEHFAIGNAPTAGNDTHGITALLNSVAKVDAANGGATTNIKVGRSLFSHNRAKLERIFATYWKHGGMQATLTVVDQEELQDALAHPEQYPNLLVRLGGWSAKFVELEKDVQQEIIRRTMY